MTTEGVVILKMFGSLLVAGIILFFMARRQKQKQDDADAQYDLTMKVIEFRNKKIGDSDESTKKT